MTDYYDLENKPLHSGGGNNLSNNVVTDSCCHSVSSEPVQADAVPLSSRRLIFDSPLGNKMKETDMEIGKVSSAGEGTVESSDMGSDSDCKYPVQAEVGEGTGKGSPTNLDKAKRIQDEEISSSSKPIEMALDVNGFPVHLEKMKFADVVIPQDEYPLWYRDGQYDGLLVFHEDDKEEALRFQEKLQRHKRPDGHPIRICHLLQLSAEAGENEIVKLENFCKKSTYLMMFLTKRFCEDLRWSYFYQNRIVVHSVTDLNKKWCAIPIHTEYWRNPETYKTPFALQGIRGICLEDSHWEEGAVRMFKERYKLLKDRVHENELKFKTWYMKEQGKRLIQWRRDKRRFLDKKQRDEEEIQRQIEASESEPMEQEQSHPHQFPYHPHISMQRNVGATSDVNPPMAPRQAWGNTGTPMGLGQPPIYSGMPGQNQGVNMAKMSPEVMQQFQFLAMQQMQHVGATSEVNPPMVPMQTRGNTGTPMGLGQPPIYSGMPGQIQDVNMAKMSPEVMQQFQAMFLATMQQMQPVYNISADVVNLGVNSKTTIVKKEESEDEDEDN